MTSLKLPTRYHTVFVGERLLRLSENNFKMPFVVIINVIDILNGQKFSFPMNSDSSYRMKHLKDEMNSLVHRFGDHRLLFIRNGENKYAHILSFIAQWYSQNIPSQLSEYVCSYIINSEVFISVYSISFLSDAILTIRSHSGR